jgi:hypothetical protein
VHLDCSDAFVLGEEFGRARAVRLRPVDPDTPADELASGAIAPERPVVFTVAEGRTAGDFIGTTMVTPYIVSPRFVHCLSEHGFTGWATFPIRVSGRMAEELAGYSGLAVTGRSGPVDDALSERLMVDALIWDE